MIKLIVLDVDGCLTDGKLYYSNDIVETKTFNVKDGLGITTWLKLGNHIAIITGRRSKIVEHRANELGIKYFYQGIREKGKVLQELVKELNIDLKNVAGIGDDLNDLSMLNLMGKTFTPKNGVAILKDSVDCILNYNGGDGAVREMIEILVKENNQEKEFLEVWL